MIALHLLTYPVRLTRERLPLSLLILSRLYYAAVRVEPLDVGDVALLDARGDAVVASDAHQRRLAPLQLVAAPAARCVRRHLTLGAEFEGVERRRVRVGALQVLLLDELDAGGEARRHCSRLSRREEPREDEARLAARTMRTAKAERLIASEAPPKPAMRLVGFVTQLSSHAQRLG